MKTTTGWKVTKAIEIAEALVATPCAMASSAKACLDDAKSAIARGDEAAAIRWARSSLAYSVGKFHAAYMAVDVLSERGA